jgi:hypothetical protein
MSLELCLVIHFLSVKHARNQAILSELEEASARSVISLRAVEKWTAAFDGRRTKFIDLSRSEVAHDIRKADPVRAQIEGEGRISQKRSYRCWASMTNM